MSALNKQTLINLLIDSPLREAIKINLIDIINNTADTDLEKTYSTITKELEIYQKATKRRLKLAGETIAQLAGTSPQSDSPTSPQPATINTPEPTPLTPPTPPTNSEPLPPLPPMPQAQVEVPKATISEDAPMAANPPLEVPKLDLPPLPTFPTPPAISDNPDITATATQPTSPQPEATEVSDTTPASETSLEGDEAALQEIQKELDALKNSASLDANPTPEPEEPISAGTPTPQPAPQFSN